MSLIENLNGIGLLGTFFAAFLGHFSIVLKDVVFVSPFLYMSQFSNPVLLGLAGGLGGGLGELGVYLAGRGVGKLTSRRENGAAKSSWVTKLGLFSVLLSSLTPLPDAPVLLLLGSAHFPVIPVIVLEIVGKTILYTGMAITGSVCYSHLNGVLPPPWGSAVIILTSLSFTIIVTWERTRKPLYTFTHHIIDKIRQLLLQSVPVAR